MAGITPTGFCATTFGGPTDQEASSGISRTKRSALQSQPWLIRKVQHWNKVARTNTALAPLHCGHRRPSASLTLTKCARHPSSVAKRISNSSSYAPIAVGTAATFVQTGTVTVYATVTIHVGLAQ